MRRDKSKQSIYSQLKNNFTRPSSRLLSPRITRKSFNSDISIPKSVQKQRLRIPKMNFIRLGSPCDTIVHVPTHIAVLKEEARQDLTKYTHKLESLIDQRASSLFKLKPKAVDSKLIDAINSIELPIKSFESTQGYQRYFSLINLDENLSEIRSFISSKTDGKKAILESIPRSFSLRENFYSTVSEIQNVSNATEKNSHNLNEFRPYNLNSAHKFIRAVKFGDAGSIVKMINSNPKIIETVDTLRQTSLHWAVKRNDQEIAMILIKHGVDVNGIDLAGRTALHIAARNDNSTLAKMLLDSGADANIKSPNGRKAMDLAPVDSTTSSLLCRLCKYS